ncbi:MAG: DUF2511 domain-containing protein [Deltaproteobacteria bacterium]|nr:DUF2511 domain-containing protein [Deltaproteobacteria bacterium]MBW2361027.1 DUF2511 domain-containing protein [Deltaproteobacteria bacterium]
MRTLSILTAVCCLALGCTPENEAEIVVTRDQLGAEWPLEVNSARLRCSDEGAVLRLGQKRYALDAAALAQGLSDAREVAIQRPDPADPDHASVPADLTPLLEACNDLAHVASGS